MAGLLVLEAITPRGRRWNTEQLAFICGCSPTNIKRIERNALKKLRRAFIEVFKRKGIVMDTDTDCELDKKIWAIVTHDRVVATDVEYAVASDIMSKLGPSISNEATIVTATAAARMEGNGPEND